MVLFVHKSSFISLLQVCFMFHISLQTRYVKRKVAKKQLCVNMKHS